MKLKYPAEAFALGIVLFSAGMREAFAAGILVILSVVFAELLKNLLEKILPAWSLRLCVYIASGAVCASVFLVGFAALGTLLDTGVWVMTFVIGLLCAHQALRGLWESAIAWGFWILMAVAREFAAGGQIFGNTVLKLGFQSAAFGEVSFAFIAAGLVLAFTNGVLKKDCRGQNSFLAAVPAMLLLHPFTTRIFGEAAGLVLTIVIPVALFFSVKQTLKFSRVSKAYCGL